MKNYGRFLFLCLTFICLISEVGSANSCVDLFAGQPTESHSPVTLKNSADVLLDVFHLILNAPKQSKVKIYTKNISGDGIGSLLLLTTVYESRRERGLTFEFYLEAQPQISRIHDLFVENSTNKIRFKTPTKEDSDQTVIVVESKEGSKSYEFRDNLTSYDLKDWPNKKAIPVNYGGRSVLRASPFKDVGVQSIPTIPETTSYNLEHISRIHMNDSDIRIITEKAFDLALQLYILKKNHVPSKTMSSLEILRELVQ